MSRDVWGALANPVRRAVLDALREGPQTTGELAAAFPDLSRFAVMQHLGVLEEAGLLLVRREGRRRLNFVNPAPLEEVRQRWLNRFASEAGRTAVALRRHVEKEREMSSKTAQSVRIESEFTVAAPPERVFAALTAEQHDWYPYNYGGPRVRSIVFEPRVGGAVYEDWGDGAGHWYGTVTHYDPPSAFALRGALAHGTVLDNEFSLAATEDGSGCVVRHSMTAFGDLDDDDLAGIRTHGDMSRFADHLRAWVEDGRSVR